MSVCLYVCMYVRMYACMYVSMNIHTHIYIYTHIFIIYARMHMCAEVAGLGMLGIEFGFGI